MSKEHEWYRADVAQGIKPLQAEDGIEQDIANSVNSEAGIIYGVAITSVGEAKGHGVQLNQEFVDEVIRFGNEKGEKGVKARFGHPTMSSTALGTFLGRVKNFRADGETARGDLFLSQEAKNSPSGDLFTYVTGLAKDDPEAFGMSIVFTPGDAFKVDSDGVKVFQGQPGFNELPGLPFATIEKLHGADAVDDPAATDDGLFSAFAGETLAGQVSVFLNQHPQIFNLIDKNPNIMNDFMDRYSEYKNKKEGINMLDETVNESDVENIESDEFENQDETTEALEATEAETVENEELENTEDVESNESSNEETPENNEESLSDDNTPDLFDDVKNEAVSLEANEPEVEPEPVKNDRAELRKFREEFGDKFGVDAFSDGLSFEEAKDKHYAILKDEVVNLKAELDGEGGDPIPFDDGGNVEKTNASYESLMDAYKKEGLSSADATKKIQKENPGLKEKWLESKQQNRKRG